MIEKYVHLGRDGRARLGGSEVKVAHATLKGGTAANAEDDRESFYPNVVNAHDVFARFCDLQSRICSSAATANAVSRR